MKNCHKILDSSFLITCVLLLHFIVWFYSHDTWLLHITASCLVTVSGINIFYTFFGVQARARKEIKVKIARLEKIVPDHIPDAQVLKYLKKFKRKERKNVKEKSCR